MKKICLLFISVLGLICEAFAEMIIINHVEPNGWIIVLFAFVNYVSVWFTMFVNSEQYKKLQISEDKSDEYNEII